MYNKFKPFFIGELGGFALSALSIAFMTFVKPVKNGVSPLGYLLGALAWLGIIVGLISFFITTAVSRIHRKRMRSGNRPGQAYRIQKLPGIFSITVRPFNLLVYAVFIVGFIVCITDLIFSYISSGLTVIVAITYYSFVIHSIIDGKNYKIYKFYKGR